MESHPAPTDQHPDTSPTEPGANRAQHWLDTIRWWPRRRWLAALALIPAAVVTFLWAGLDLPTGTTPPAWGWAVGVLAGVLAGLTLSSYVPGPGSGHLIEVGCSPCALASAASVAGALYLRGASPTSGGIAVATVAILALGLQRRLSDAAACPVTTRQPHGS